MSQVSYFSHLSSRDKPHACCMVSQCGSSWVHVHKHLRTSTFTACLLSSDLSSDLLLARQASKQAYVPVHGPLGMVRHVAARISHQHS
jgi:hypothetical protein